MKGVSTKETGDWRRKSQLSVSARNSQLAARNSAFSAVEKERAKSKEQRAKKVAVFSEQLQLEGRSRKAEAGRKSQLAVAVDSVILGGPETSGEGCNLQPATRNLMKNSAFLCDNSATSAVRILNAKSAKNTQRAQRSASTREVGKNSASLCVNSAFSAVKEINRKDRKEAAKNAKKTCSLWLAA